MSFLAGVAIGGLVSGMVSDRLGRKKTLMVSLCLQIVIGVTIAFVPILEVFAVLRFLLGFVSVGVVFSGFVLCVELVGGKWRTVAGVGYLVPVPISYMIISGIAYCIRGWRDLQLAITLPSILLLPLWCILPESPRWLMAMGKVEDNVEILKEAAQVNKRTLPPNIDKLLQQLFQGLNEKTGEQATILDLFRYPRLRKISLVNFVIWFAVYFMYYGLMMNLSNIGGDIYVNTVISGGVEIPALLLSAVILLKLGRRWPLSVTIFTSGIACLTTLPFGTAKESVTIGLAMLGKFCIACSNAIMPIYTAELYPTVVRNLGVGLSNVSAGMALILVPFIWNLATIDSRLPFGLLGSIGCIGGLSVLLLEETSNRPLKKSLED
ncbi:UNVERIFIED_CONTAM: hypothetical protein PYX00_003794 [Menopon gallinae]|uniref:Major facilitator superfamily (MFS) profile domain-containing protein n=1 Tax=Menopon gallinae TaxID=328185 RepID=A0AAW2I2W6_9NEOP